MILQGVRRCVAANVAGKPDVPAVIHVPGQPDLLTRVSLDDLFSPKPHIVRDHRYIRDTEYPTLVLGTEPPPITVTPVTQKAAARLTPIRQVRLI
jgi:hypothetical protein